MWRSNESCDGDYEVVAKHEAMNLWVLWEIGFGDSYHAATDGKVRAMTILPQDQPEEKVDKPILIHAMATNRKVQCGPQQSAVMCHSQIHEATCRPCLEVLLGVLDMRSENALKRLQELFPEDYPKEQPKPALTRATEDFMNSEHFSAFKESVIRYGKSTTCPECSKSFKVCECGWEPPEDKTDCGCHLCNGVSQHDQDMNYMCDTCKEEAEPPAPIEPLVWHEQDLTAEETVAKINEVIARLEQ